MLMGMRRGLRGRAAAGSRGRLGTGPPTETQQRKQGNTTMALLIEGRFTGKAVHGDVGRRSPKSPVTVNIDCEITEGEHKGKRFQYVGKCGTDNIKYTK